MKLKIIIAIGVIILIIGGIILTFTDVLDGKKDKTKVEKVKTKKPSEILFDLKVDEYSVEKQEVKANQTIGSILAEAGLSVQLIDSLVNASIDIFDVRSIRTGNPYYLFFAKDTAKGLQYFIYQIDKINYVKYDFTDSIEIFLDQKKVVVDTIVSSGVITSSLWNTMKEANIDPLLALNLSDIYAWTIDFYGLQENDSFKVAYITNSIDSTVVGIKRILASNFYHAGKYYYAFYFVQDGEGKYFDKEGNSSQRAFLKAPLKFSRISSGFTNSRFHPVLKIRRPHHGVDYAAATGTPVMSIGDGKVTSANWAGGYGKRVVVRHSGTYSSGYAHLSRFANGISNGVSVKQGEIIGYVGSTGLATGPHLDFRVYQNGKPIDPLKVVSPPAVPIKKDNRKEFDALVKNYIEMIE